MKPVNYIKYFDISSFEKSLSKRGHKKYYISFCIILEISKIISHHNGCIFLVGGTVRDILMGIMPKDFDIEIHGILPEQIDDIIGRFGKISKVGKSFGITKLSIKNGIEIDISVPRRDSKVGIGHRGFNIEIDINMGIAEACKRRDFTINSIALDLITYEIHDPYGGMQDIENHTLKVTHPETFIDDPLRALRCIQFISRFRLNLDIGSISLIARMIPLLKELPRERIGEEWRKLLLKSAKPSLGLITAMELGILETLHPELYRLNYTEQDAIWHSEGNVWIHTMMVLDYIQVIAGREKLSSLSRLCLSLAGLCHDLGKPITTKEVNGRITSYNHEAEGIIPTQIFLSSINIPQSLQEKIIPLVQYHLAPVQLYGSEQNGDKITDGTIRRLAQKLFPASIYDLVLLAEADYFGRGGRSPGDIFLAGKWLLERASVLSVDVKKPENIVSGKELLSLGYTSGKEIGDLIFQANQLRDNQELSKDEILLIFANKRIQSFVL